VAAGVGFSGWMGGSNKRGAAGRVKQTWGWEVKQMWSRIMVFGVWHVQPPWVMLEDAR
jgi:hypothetical protein